MRYCSPNSARHQESRRIFCGFKSLENLQRSFFKFQNFALDPANLPSTACNRDNMRHRKSRHPENYLIAFIRFLRFDCYDSHATKYNREHIVDQSAIGDRTQRRLQLGFKKLSCKKAGMHLAIQTNTRVSKNFGQKVHSGGAQCELHRCC